MSEKRFELKLCSDGAYYLYENNELIVPYIDFDKFNKESAERIIDLLNPLFYEHKQLLQSFENYKKSHNVIEQRLNALSDENEQLKKQCSYWKHRVNSLLWILGQFDKDKVKELLKELEDE